MIIYVLISDAFDGDCSYQEIIKAFKDKQKAEEFAINCQKETDRIRKEIKAHYEKYREELDNISNILRKKIMTHSKKKIVIEWSKCPQSIRRKEIINKTNRIYKSHKYHPDFGDIDDQHEYNIVEVELE